MIGENIVITGNVDIISSNLLGENIIINSSGIDENITIKDSVLKSNVLMSGNSWVRSSPLGIENASFVGPSALVSTGNYDHRLQFEGGIVKGASSVDRVAMSGFALVRGNYYGKTIVNGFGTPLRTNNQEVEEYHVPNFSGSVSDSSLLGNFSFRGTIFNDVTLDLKTAEEQCYDINGKPLGNGKTLRRSRFNYATRGRGETYSGFWDIGSNQISLKRPSVCGEPIVRDVCDNQYPPLCQKIEL